MTTTLQAIIKHLGNNGIPSYNNTTLTGQPFIRIPQGPQHHNIDIYLEQNTIKLTTNYTQHTWDLRNPPEHTWNLANPNLLPELIQTIWGESLVTMAGESQFFKTTLQMTTATLLAISKHLKDHGIPNSTFPLSSLIIAHIKDPKDSPHQYPKHSIDIKQTKSLIELYHQGLKKKTWNLADPSLLNEILLTIQTI